MTLKVLMDTIANTTVTPESLQSNMIAPVLMSPHTEISKWLIKGIPIISVMEYYRITFSNNYKLDIPGTYTLLLSSGVNNYITMGDLFARSTNDFRDVDKFSTNIVSLESKDSIKIIKLTSINPNHVTSSDVRILKFEKVTIPDTDPPKVFSKIELFLDGNSQSNIKLFPVSISKTPMHFILIGF